MQACAKWSELHEAFMKKDHDKSTTLDFGDFKVTLNLSIGACFSEH